MRDDAKHPADGMMNRSGITPKPTENEQTQQRDEFAALLADFTCPDPSNRFGTYVLKE
tara:strand:+ start:578 stop:751 length:174 start_codon:yes stop_codon:yes gene_type:complete